MTREQIVAQLDAGCSYDEAARQLGITAGLAYLTVTGIPADGSDTVTADQRERPHVFPGTTQHLANPQPAENPTRDEAVIEWVRQRARGDRQMQAAARAAEAKEAAS